MSRPSKKNGHPGPENLSDFHDILMNAPIGVFTSTPDGRYISVNHATAEMLGYDNPQELISSITDIASQVYVNPEDRKEFIRLIEKQGEVQNYECRFRRRDGSEFWVSRNVCAVRNKDGRIVAYQGFNTDITDRKQAEDALKDSEDQFRAMFEKHHAVMLLIDPDNGKIIRANQSAEKYYGYTAAEIENMTIQQINQLAKEEIASEMANAKAQKRNYFYFRHKLANNEIRDVEVHSSPIPFKEKTILFSIIHDITESKWIETDLQRQTALLTSLLDSIPDIIFIKDIQGVYLGCNTEFSRHVGMRKSDIIWGTDYDLYTKEEADFFRTNDKLMLEQGKPRHNEELISYPDGRRIVLDTLKTPYRDAGGDVLGIIGICRDITDRKTTEEAINQQYMQMRTVIDTDPNYIFVKDVDGCFLLANKAVADVFGVDPEEIIGKTDLDYGATEEQARAYNMIDRGVIENGKSLLIPEEQIMRKDGSLGWFQTVKTPYSHPGWSKPAILGVAVDITARKQAEDILREREEQFRLITENMGDVIWLRSADNTEMHYVSPSYEHVWGRTCQSLYDVPQSFMESVHPDDLEEVHAAFGRYLHGGRFDLEYRIQRPDGGLRWVHARSYAICDEKRNIIKHAGVATDITERKKSEEALKESEKQYRTIFQGSRDGYVMVDIQGRIVDANQAFCNMLGFTLDELKQMQDFYTITPERWRKWELEEIWQKRLLGQGYSGIYEKEYIRGDGQVFPVELQSYAVHDEDGNIMFLWGVARDITERKRFEQDLLQAKEAAETANQAKSEFLANMSHEIRTPLNGIIGMMQLLSATGLNPDQEELVSLGSISAKRLTQLLSDILDLSSIEAGKMIIRENEFSLHDICSSIKDLFMIPARQKGIEFDCSIDCSLDSSLPARIIGDDTRVQQILFNLVGNAVKFTEDGSVSLNISPVSQPENGYMRISFSITDTGTGIPDDKLDKLFQPFSQADGSMTRQYQGAGLGLVIVRRLVSMMDGIISIESEPGEGTTVHVVLPFKISEMAPSQDVQGTVQPVRKSGGLNILLAEDDSLNQMLIKRMLEKDGQKVTLAENGKEAVDMLQEKEFDCILMDIQMPVMDGVEATQLIRAQEIRRQKSEVRDQTSDFGNRSSALQSSAFSLQPSGRIPIIAVTAHTQPGDRERFLEAGMDDYIGKPVSLEDFHRVFSKFFSGSEQD